MVGTDCCCPNYAVLLLTLIYKPVVYVTAPSLIMYQTCAFVYNFNIETVYQDLWHKSLNYLNKIFQKQKAQAIRKTDTLLATQPEILVSLCY